MRIMLAMSLTLSCGWAMVSPPQLFAQRFFGGAVDAAAARVEAQGDFVRNMGWYNLNSARAESIQVDSMIRWKEDLRKIAREREELHDRYKAFQKMKADERKKAIEEDDKRLRTDPTAEDIYRGFALNALLVDLMDPSITPSHWRAFQVQLPKGASVKALVMRYMPSKSDVAHPLGRGVISLARLELDGKWPTPLMVSGLDDKRKGYEDACRKLRTNVIDGKFDVDNVLQLNTSLDILQAEVQRVVPTQLHYRSEATAYVNELRNSTRFFDAKTVDYAREMLKETAEYDAKTVAELVAFLLKYRLQFASVEQSPSGRALYSELYISLRQQADSLGASLPENKVKR